MKLLSIEYIPGVEFEALGIVKGTVVQTKNCRKRFHGRDEDPGRRGNHRLYGNAQ